MKKILLTLIFALAVVLSISALYASDVNVTDAQTTSIADNTPTVSTDQSSNICSQSSNALESENSNTLLTNNQDNNILSDKAQSTISASNSITAKNITKYYKGSTKYTAKFLNTDGSVLAKTNVKITVNGKDYTKKTDSKGTVSLDINLNPGTYIITATNPNTGFNLTTTFKILSTITASDVTKIYTEGKKFTATFLKSNGKALANKKVKFKINGKTYTKKTTKKGVASLSLKSLKPGTYKIITYNNGLTKVNYVKVVKSSSTSLSLRQYFFTKKETKKVKVRLLNRYGKAPTKGQTIKFYIAGKTYTAKTSKKGYATFTLPSLKVGTYAIKCSFAKHGVYKSSTAKSKVTIASTNKATFTLKSTKTFGYGAGTSFKLALTAGKVPLPDQTVTLTIKDTTYTKKTDKNGMISLPIDFKVGKYTITYSNKATSKINSKSESVTIDVIKRAKTSLKLKTPKSFAPGKRTCQILLVDSHNKPLAKATVKITINSKTYIKKTSSKGYATLNLKFPKGKYKISYTYEGSNLNAPSSGSANLKVAKITKLSIKSIANAALKVKSYCANNNKLPKSVKVGKVSCTMPEFLYLMSKAIYQISKSNSKSIVYIKGISSPKTPSGDDINDNLYKSSYLTVAKKIVNFISSNKRAPNYSSSSLGKITYKEMVDAESRILSFYASHNRLPKYVSISTSSSGGGGSQTGTGLNEKNTIKDLSGYLKSSSNCPVDNAAIKKVVKSVTKGLKSKSAKAKAIFKYVRDTLSYSFYFNTKRGAVGTLKAKSGNCVDHSHLLVAMFRTAKIPARYVHGNCKFTSGSTYGHVWAQVLVNGKWTVVDATSSRNTFGKVSNWNTKTFTLNGIYRSLPF